MEPELSHWVTELNLETGGERPLNDDISPIRSLRNPVYPLMVKSESWDSGKYIMYVIHSIQGCCSYSHHVEGADSWCTIQAGLTRDYIIGDIHHILMDGLPFTWRTTQWCRESDLFYHHASSHLAVRLIRWVYIIASVKLKLLKIPLWKGFHL